VNSYFFALKGRLTTNNDFSGGNQEALRNFTLHVFMARVTVADGLGYDGLEHIN
jgi:hypothetical protein